MDGKQKDCILAQLLQVFGVVVNNAILYMAYILPMDADPYEVESINMAHAKLKQEIDKALRLTRIRSRPRAEATCISVESIIRGALVAEGFEENQQKDEYLIIDVIDEDMWWRMKSVRLVQNSGI